MDDIHPEAWPEQREGDQQQQNAFVPAATDQEVALGARRKDQHRQRRDDENHHAVPEVHIDQQQIGVEDEQERQRGGAQAVVERHHTGLDRIALGHSSSRERGQPDRRRDVRHDAEIEDEQVHRNQWHDQPALLTQRHHNRRQQAGHHNVVGGGRQPHAENQAEECREQQHQHQVAHGQQLDQVSQHQAHTGL